MNSVPVNFIYLRTNSINTASRQPCAVKMRKVVFQKVNCSTTKYVDYFGYTITFVFYNKHQDSRNVTRVVNYQPYQHKTLLEV